MLYTSDDPGQTFTEPVITPGSPGLEETLTQRCALVNPHGD